MRAKNRIADALQNFSRKMVKNTVGKSFPIGMHEVKLSDQVKDWATKESKH